MTSHLWFQVPMHISMSAPRGFFSVTLILMACWGGLNELNPQKMGGNNLLIDLGVFYVLTKPLGTLTILCQQNEGIEITMKIIWDLRHKNACGFWQQHTGKRTN